jgi:spermidine synthase
MAAELWLIRWQGINGTATVAASIGLVAVAIALWLRNSASAEAAAVRRGRIAGTDALRFLLAAFMAGAAMLGLEVLWFRFLLLFQPGTSLAFAVMLATVLGGIALGGIVAARLYAMQVIVHRGTRSLAGVSALLVAAGYATFPAVQSRYLVEFGASGFQSGFVIAAVILMLPVAVLSGVIFTALGRGLKEAIGDSTAATAWLALANTAGAMIGSLVAGFLLLPLLGIERSLFAMILLYGMTALLVPRSSGREVPMAVTAAAVFLLGIVLFPFGLMRQTFLGDMLAERFPGTTTVAVREGLTETAAYLRTDRLGQPYFYRLLTNSYSMSTTGEQSMRYMKSFVYLPVALLEEPRDALLISYGIGNTAKALTDTERFESIDIVDISRDILELSDIAFPEAASHPLNDDRVSVHVEDGRFFLQVTDRQFDLITAEPPPPTISGVVNLYTQEYFELIRARLKPGGISSYWLPGHALEEDATKAIIKAFCNVFADCTLWSGAGMDWILLGSRDAQGPAEFDAFSRQWRDPAVAPELRAIGVENPQQLGALFMADTRELREVTADVLPVVDAWPFRIVLPVSGSRKVPPLYAWLMNTERSANSFANSQFVRTHWPAGLIEATLPYFAYQRLINQRHAPGLDAMPPPHPLETLRHLLLDTDLESLPLWLLGSNYFEQRLLDNVAGKPEYAAQYEWGQARRAIAERRYPQALAHLESLGARTDPANAAGLERLRSLVISLQAADQE